MVDCADDLKNDILYMRLLVRLPTSCLVCACLCIYIYSRDLICLNVYFSMFSAMMCSCRAMPDKLFACMIVYMWSGLELFECLFLCFRA